jgi:glycerol-3-phosphate dehydrogenase (NAD(P)+)
MNYPNNYISVIGSGSWGTTLANLLAEKSYDVMLWAYEKDLAEQINKERTNAIYLPDVVLSDNLKATNDIEEAVSTSRYIVNAVPTQHIRSIFNQVKSHIREESIIINASKGIEMGTLLTPSMILKEILNKPASVISGPSFAKEVSAKLPTAVTLASEDKKTCMLLQEIFNTDYFRVYTHDDIVGVEIGGALKNVIAIASGICDGLKLGYNSRAALITRGLVEITKLGIVMNAQKKTFSGLSGLGDLVLTCTAPLSRNYSVGYKLGQGQKLSEIISQSRSVIEGVTTTKSAYALSKKYNIEMPITEQIYLTLYKEKSPEETIKDLMNRALKSEFYEH